jgi:hypothetical protein
MITPLPMNISMEPMVETIVKRAAFLTMSQKVIQAAGQKLSLVRATWMYAFFVIYLTHESRHQMQHLRQHIRHFMTKLSPINFSYFFLMYSKASLIICMIAIIMEPKAMVPR